MEWGDGYRDMLYTFADSGLVAPPIPQQLRSGLEQIAPWCWSTRDIDPMAMYMSDVCTVSSNLSGQPAISVPFGTGDDGLPIGVQVMANTLDEVTMFKAAGVLEEAAP